MEAVRHLRRGPLTARRPPLRELTAITEDQGDQQRWARARIVFPVEVDHSALRAKGGGAHGFALSLLGTDRPRQATVIEAACADNPGAHRSAAPARHERAWRKMAPVRRFGPLEAVIMDRLWASGRAMTGREVHEAIDRDPAPAYTTVTSVLDILCRKGFLRRHRVGRAFRYCTLATREAYSAELMGEALGSSKNPAATLLEFVGRLEPGEAASLRAALEPPAGPDGPAGDLGQHGSGPAR